MYSPWCKLVEIKVTAGGGGNTVAVYQYNGAGIMIAEQTDTSDSSYSGIPDGDVDAYDPVFYLATDPQGRRVGVYRDTDTYPKETFLYHPDGVRGPAVAGGVMLRDRDGDLYGNLKAYASEPAASTRTERVYYCSDFRSNVSALVWSDGTLAEQVRYSATGIPFGIPLGDVNGDGLVEGAGSGDVDWDEMNYMKTAYAPRGDANLDGVVDSADQTIAVGMDGVATGRGIQSTASSRNAIGWLQFVQSSNSEAPLHVYGSNATHWVLGLSIVARIACEDIGNKAACQSDMIVDDEAAREGDSGESIVMFPSAAAGWLVPDVHTYSICYKRFCNSPQLNQPWLGDPCINESSHARCRGCCTAMVNAMTTYERARSACRACRCILTPMPRQCVALYARELAATLTYWSAALFECNRECDAKWPNRGQPLAGVH